MEGKKEFIIINKEQYNKLVGKKSLGVYLSAPMMMSLGLAFKKMCSVAYEDPNKTLFIALVAAGLICEGIMAQQTFAEIKEIKSLKKAYTDAEDKDQIEVSNEYAYTLGIY